MIKNGDLVTVHYTGMLEDGQIFDSSVGNEPIQFKIGDNQVIEGFETAVLGLKPTDKITVKITPEKGYGFVREDFILTVPIDKVPKETTVGAVLQGIDRNGSPFEVIVKEMNDETVVLDSNHPLAGKNMIFEIEIVEVK